MSIATGRNGLKISIPDGDSAGEYAGYTRVVNPHQTLTKTISGSTFELEVEGWLAGGVQRMTWNGVNYINAADHGQGFQWAYNIIPTDLYPMNGGNFTTLSGLLFAPVEQGNITDGSNANVCSSDQYEAWLRNDGLAIITTVNPANWGDPTDTIAPTPRSIRRLSGYTTRAERIIGYDGNDHIIQSLSTVIIPDEDWSGYPQGLFCDLTAYGVGATFTVCKSVNLDTGVATDVTPPSDGTITHSQTAPRMWCNADSSHCFAVYSPLSMVGTHGFLGGRKGVNANSFHFRSIEPVVAGEHFAPSFLCFGAEATVIAALQQVYGDFP